MQYMGGKSRISTQIAQVINHALNLGGGDIRKSVLWLLCC